MVGEETDSESESEPEPIKRRKPKVKARADKSPPDVKAESSEGSDSAVDSAELEEPDDVADTDARPRTRGSGLGVAVKQEERREYAIHHLQVSF